MSSYFRLRAWVPVAIGLALTASCSSDPGPNRSAGTSKSPALDAPPLDMGAPRVRPPIDLQTVAKNAALAFREDHGAFAAAGSTFEAKISGASIDVTPRRASTSALPPLVADAGSPLTLHTSRIARGSHVLASDDARAWTTLEADGSVSVRRGAVVERVSNDDAGVEQSWQFDERPSGEGDLVVRVRASGQRYSKSSDHGLHFDDASGLRSRGLGLRYGTATWVDANGQRTVVVPRFVDGEIVMAVPNDVIATSAYPAVLDPTVTPERAIDEPISGSSASGDQYSAAVVSAGPGKGYVAVWYDRRGIRPSLYAARINSDGTVADDSGIPIATGVASTTPSIAASDDGFLVTWAVSYVDLYQSPGVYAVRLDAQANPIDTTPLTLVSNQTNLQQPTAAFDGTSWFVSWSRYAGGTTSYDIAGARVPRTGAAVLDAKPIEISNGPEAEYEPIVAFDGTAYLVAWRTYSAIFGRRYGKDGKAIGDRLVLATSSGNSVYAMRLATQGAQHLLVWSDFSPTTSYDIFARRINLDGSPIDPANIVVNADPGYDEAPRVTWDGASFVVAWSRSGQLAAARVNTAGGVLDPTPVMVTTSGNYYENAIASDGVGSIAVSRIYGSGLAASDVNGVKIGKPPTAAATPFLVSKAANSETEPSVAWNGTTHFSVWLDTRDGRPAIYGAALAADGKTQPAAKIVSDPRFASDLTRPRIASDGSGFLVTFYAYDQTGPGTGNRRAIRGLRLDATGKPDAAGIFDIYVPTNVNDLVREPAVAFDGANYLVVWENQTTDGSNQTSIAGVRLGKTSTLPLDKEPIRITTATPVEQRSAPSVAFDGQNYFVAWITSRPAPGSGIQVSHVFGTRVSREGAVLDGEQSVCNAFLLQRAPHVAGDIKNGGFMVVWEDYRTALEAADIYGARISAQGANIDGTSGMKIAVGMTDESRPRVSASGDGTNYVVAWRDLRSKQTYDLYGAWISRAGKNHDPAGLLLSAEGGDEDAPWLSPSSDGNLVIAYQRLDPRTGYGSYRVRARAIAGGARVAAACTKDDDCASRSCVDGVCCSTDCGGCGACNVTPGTCTPRAAGSETKTCPAYKCKGTLECPNKCEKDEDCASNATCDPSTKACVSRVICIDEKTLKDLSGKQTACAPYRCVADACRTQCGSVDDCAAGFVCDYGGRCVQAPTGNDGGCAVPASSSSSTSSLLAAAVWLLATVIMRRRRA